MRGCCPGRSWARIGAEGVVPVDVRSLELFLAVSEKQSISKAAQENYVSRQALTEAMA